QSGICSIFGNTIAFAGADDEAPGLEFAAGVGTAVGGGTFCDLPPQPARTHTIAQHTVISAISFCKTNNSKWVYIEYAPRTTLAQADFISSLMELAG
ncbi:MAG TPA: hypothetical protein VJW55_01165, partial [Candidatus Angelobacter sp.]|nr:hypothetical protein [Candidatus Angelobacter sp.]